MTRGVLFVDIFKGKDLKKSVCCVGASILCLLSTNALAEWIHVIDISQGAIYADKALMREIDGYPQMMDLLDLKVKDRDSKGTPYSSVTHTTQYDCQGKRLRMMESAMYTEAMGKGNSLGRIALVNKDGSLTPGSWKSVPQGTAFERLLKIACDSSIRSNFP